MPRGKKICPNCKQECGVRLHQCNCGHMFSQPTKESTQNTQDKFNHFIKCCVKTHKTNGTIEDVAQSMNISVQKAINRYTLLQKKGVHLPVIALNTTTYKKKTKGRKSCPKCETIVGIATKICPKCQHEYQFETKVARTLGKIKLKRIKNWRELQPGDKIRCKGGGPYYLPEEGDRIYMSSKGNFTVSQLTDNGIEAYGQSGFEFILMVDLGFNPETQLYREPHKIFSIMEK